MTLEKKIITQLNIILINLKTVLDYVPSNNNIILYRNQKDYLINNITNTIKIIDNYIDSIKNKYNLQQVLSYPIKNTYSLEQNIINIELIELMYKFILNSVDIIPIDIIKLSQLLNLYLKKIDVFIKYPSSWIGSEQAVWNPYLYLI